MVTRKLNVWYVSGCVCKKNKQDSEWNNNVCSLHLPVQHILLLNGFEGYCLKAVSLVFAKHSFASLLHSRASEASVLRSFHMILSFFPLVSNSQKSIETDQLIIIPQFHVWREITCISIICIANVGPGSLRNLGLTSTRSHFCSFSANFKTLSFSFFTVAISLKYTH